VPEITAPASQVPIFVPVRKQSVGLGTRDTVFFEEGVAAHPAAIITSMKGIIEPSTGDSVPMFFDWSIWRSLTMILSHYL
jgi:hypothetical protein